MVSVSKHKVEKRPRERHKRNALEDDTSPVENYEEAPKGASIEYEVTGKDAVGGIQLQIIPQYQLHRMHFSSLASTVLREKEWVSTKPVLQEGHRFSALNSPKDLQLKRGDTIHVKDLDRQQIDRPKVAQDLLCEASSKRFAAIDLHVFFEQPFQSAFKVYKFNTASTPVVLDVSTF